MEPKYETTEYTENFLLTDSVSSVVNKNRLVVGPSPHLQDRDSVPRIMWSVVAALLPALIAAIIFFGWYAAAVVGVAVVFALATEYACQKIRGAAVTAGDGSAVVTGLLLAFVLPPNVPLYLPAIGSVFAIAIVKQAFGGLGCNIWNPALAARAFLLAAYSGFVVMPQWPILNTFVAGDIRGVDAVTKATPLVILRYNPLQFFEHYSLAQLITGQHPGCIGETSLLALLVGAAFLIIKKYVNWRLPLSYILTVAILVVFLPISYHGDVIGFWQASYWADPGAVIYRSVAHVLSGGLILGAFFMATDMVTSPLTGRGQVLFGIGCGILVAIIRLYGGYPEGVCYSILIMNTVVWVIDRYTKPKLFGCKNSPPLRGGCVDSSPPLRGGAGGG